MIAFVRGTVAAVAPDTAVVDVGGVGVEVQCTPATLSGLRVGETATLPTVLVVREDSLTLYGFADTDERTLFELLQTASGVGPRLAQAMLAVHSPNALRLAFANGDEKALTQVPGIGRKGAQRLLLELRDRLGAPTGGAITETRGGRGVEAEPWRARLHAALTGLGWSSREADTAVAAVAPEAEAGGGAPPDLPALLRSALRTLNRS